MAFGGRKPSMHSWGGDEGNHRCTFGGEVIDALLGGEIQEIIDALLEGKSSMHFWGVEIQEIIDALLEGKSSMHFWGGSHRCTCYVLRLESGFINVLCGAECVDEWLHQCTWRRRVR